MSVSSSSSSYGRPAQLSWCNVCGQAVVTSASGPIGMGIRIDDDTIVHEHCFKCSSCHRRLSLETYRQDKLDKRFYCAKHHNGYNVVGATQSLPRGARYSVNSLPTTNRSTSQGHSESPAERRRISTPASVSGYVSRSPGVTPSSPQSQRPFGSSASYSSLQSVQRSPLSVKSAQRGSPAHTPAHTPTTVSHAQASSIHRTYSSGSDAQESNAQKPSPATAKRLKATRAAHQMSEGRADMPSIETKLTVPADDSEERHRSGSMPRKTSASDSNLARNSSSRSTKSDGYVTRRRASARIPTDLDLTSQVSSASSLADDVLDDSESCVDTTFLHELQQYKTVCKHVAERMEENGEGNGGMVTPTSSDAMATTTTIPPSGSVTPRQFKRLPIPELWSSASESSRFVQPVYGYFTEAIGSPKSTKRLSTQSSPRGRAPSPMLDRRSSRTALVSPEDVRDRYKLDPMKEELYEEHFHGREHWNFYVQNEPDIGACILSFKQEVVDDREQFRILIRCQYAIVHGHLPPACLLANRYNRKDVVDALKKEMGFVGRFRQALSPSAPDEILKLDKAFSSRQLKVGLLYVAPGQRAEEEIFNNEAGSRNFEDFMGEIGDRITLKAFSGFRGGLDAKHEQTGEHSLYREWNGHEIMFHVSTLLPFSKTDRQQLQKKRHIGNDMVCVVFVDDMDTPFNPTCIRSHFLHTFLVVHCDTASFPKRYRVDVVARDSVPQFGPALVSQNVFPAGSQIFSEFFLTKLVNSYRASCRAAKFHRLKIRTLTQMVKEATNGFALHELETTGHRHKMQRRGSWLPDGAVRPPSPLRDSMRERYVESERLAQDLRDLRTACKDLCDVNFIVGERREAVCAIKAVLAVRSVSFRDFFHSLADVAAADDAATADQEGSSSGGSGGGSVKLPKRSSGSNRIKLKMPRKEKSRSESLGHSLPSAVANSSAGTGTATTAGSNGSPIVRRKSKKGRHKNSSDSQDQPSSLTPEDSIATTSSTTHYNDDANMGVIQENEVLVIKAPPLSMIVHQLAKGIEVFQVNDFSLEAFSAALDFIHSGTCDVTPAIVVGLVCAAALMEMPALEKAISGGLNGLLRPSTIMEVLNGAEPYYQRHMAAKSFITNVVGPFCEINAKLVLSDPSFSSLCDTTVTMLYQLKLNCSEVLKFEAALKWSHAETKRRCLDPEDYTQLLRPLVGHVDLMKISTKDLMHKVLPTGAVQEDKVLMALAYQADPGAMQSLEGKPLDSKTLLQLALEREAMTSATLSSPPTPARSTPSPSPRITEL